MVSMIAASVVGSSATSVRQEQDRRHSSKTRGNTDTLALANAQVSSPLTYRRCHRRPHLSDELVCLRTVAAFDNSSSVASGRHTRVLPDGVDKSTYLKDDCDLRAQTLFVISRTSRHRA